MPDLVILAFLAFFAWVARIDYVRGVRPHQRLPKTWDDAPFDTPADRG